MWQDRRLLDLLGIEHPIIQSPMLGASPAAMVASVSNAGGLGSLPCGSLPLDQVAPQVDDLRAHTNKPFNLNFFVQNERPRVSDAALALAREKLAPFADDLGGVDLPEALSVPDPVPSPEMIDYLCDVRPPVVSFHFGVPDAAVLSRLKSADITLMCSATNVAEARVLEAAGIDVIIAQGWEAGGHRGAHRATLPHEGVGTMALVPQIVDAVSVPVVAAGGIADGRGIVAALALGASAVQMGTAFLCCPEATTDAPRLAHLAKAQDTDTMFTDAGSGHAARALRTPYSEAMAPFAGNLPPFPTMYQLSRPLIAAAQAAGSDDVSFLLYGQAAALNESRPAAELVADWVEDAQKRMAAMAR